MTPLIRDFFGRKEEDAGHGFVLEVFGERGSAPMGRFRRSFGSIKEEVGDGREEERVARGVFICRARAGTRTKDVVSDIDVHGTSKFQDARVCIPQHRRQIHHLVFDFHIPQPNQPHNPIPQLTLLPLPP